MSRIHVCPNGSAAKLTEKYQQKELKLNCLNHSQWKGHCSYFKNI